MFAPPRLVLVCVVLVAGCVDRTSGVRDVGLPLPDGSTDSAPQIELPDGSSDALVSDVFSVVVDALSLDTGAVGPEDARPAPADYDPLADRPVDDRDPLCREIPPLEGSDDLDWAGDCGERQEKTIRGIRNPTCPEHEELPTEAPGRDIVLDEVVVTAIFGHDFVVQDTEGVAFNAVWVHNQSGLDTAELALGDRVALEGELIRFFELDELIIHGGGYELLGGGPVIEPTVLVDSSRVADRGDLERALESRLVRLENQRVINTAPDCPTEFGNFVLESTLWVGNEADFDTAPSRDDVLRSVTGILSVGFDHRKILPRGNEDLEVVACGGLPDKCEEAECPVAEDAEESGALVITEIQNNPSGSDTEREFIELYNSSGDEIDLRGWWVQDCGGRRAELSGTLQSEDLLVLAASTDRGENGGVPADLPMGEIFLPNGFGSVLVFDADDRLVDQVRYAPDNPWPNRDPGESLELEAPDRDNRDGANWRKGRDSYGAGGDGSPGELP